MSGRRLDTPETGKSISARRLYGSARLHYGAHHRNSRKMLAKIEGTEYAKFPVCIAKTQYSFSQDPKLYGAPEGFEFDIKDVVINAGAEMIVAIAGDIIRMPGLPKSPQALRIDVKDGAIASFPSTGNAQAWKRPHAGPSAKDWAASASPTIATSMCRR